MKHSLVSGSLTKAATGIEGLDEITQGGLPRGRASLLIGGPGSGKTILALQTLVNGARQHNEPGIFVTFEEDSRRVITNAAGFGWDLPRLQRRKLFFLDARPKPDLVTAGAFDLNGLLAGLTAKVRSLRARRIVFDSIDVLLELLANPVAERREIYRLHNWLLEQDLTAIITAKASGERAGPPGSAPFGFMQFMVDCAIVLNHDLVQGVSQRNLRVVKYRGSAFAENESPFVIGTQGFEVAGARDLTQRVTRATTERVSSGVARLDTMLGGGYFRGASVLITGSPGTAKSTLCGTFAEAACRRGEPTLMVSFDSEPSELVRNLASVNIKLAGHQKRGRLRVVSMRSGVNSAEVQFMHIKGLAHAHRTRCLVIDPVSALAKQGNELTAHSVVERLTDWTRAAGITLLCTSLLDGVRPESESTPLQISTIADTWIHLSYLVHAGERNRALTIIKSRGTAHSNQVRELVLGHDGVTMADVYAAGGEVLMGTLRWEKEQAERLDQRRRETEARQRLTEIRQAETELAGRLETLERELAARRAERERLTRAENRRQNRAELRHRQVRKMRGGDVQPRETNADEP